MKYIYNVKVNFNIDYLDFFEWNENDLILNIKKMPIIKVKKNTYKQLLTNIVQFDKIKYVQLLKNNKYVSITNGYDVFIIKINKNFISVHRSSILIYDELDITYMAQKMKVSNISFKVIKALKKNIYLRNENEKKFFIIKQLKKSIKNNDNKIVYLNYEFLNNYIQNKQIAFKNLLNSMDNPILLQNLYNFLINDATIN